MGSFPLPGINVRTWGRVLPGEGGMSKNVYFQCCDSWIYFPVIWTPWIWKCSPTMVGYMRGIEIWGDVSLSSIQKGDEIFFEKKEQKPRGRWFWNKGLRHQLKASLGGWGKFHAKHLHFYCSFSFDLPSYGSKSGKDTHSGCCRV